MIKVESENYVGKTAVEMLAAETQREIYGAMFSHAYLLFINGQVVDKKDYASRVIEKGDLISLFPIYTGG